MNDLTHIKDTGRKIRMGFWGIIVISILLLVGSPRIFNIHIELIAENTWLFSLFSLMEAFFPHEDSIPWSTGNTLVLIAGFLLLSALFVLLIASIDRLFLQYQSGHVYTQTCAKYFRLIGWSLVAIFIVDNLLGNWIEHIYHTQDVFDSADLDVALEADFLTQVIALDFSYLMAGLFVLAVAKAVVLGVALQEDVDATV